MEKPFSDDVSVNVLRRMKEGGFDFARIHPIDFFAIFPSEREARQAAGQFRGESLGPRSSLATMAPGTCRSAR